MTADQTGAPDRPESAAQLLHDLTELAAEWDQEAKDRHLDGMAGSAEALRSCRDELRAVIRRHSR